MALGNPSLTHITPQQRRTRPGMAYFANTGPIGKHCADCAFWGYHRERAEKYDPRIGQNVVRKYRHNGCEKYRQMTGTHGPVISRDLAACKYFEARK